jgi:UDP-N-acetylmuramyl pentapeptide synthase
MKFLQEKLDGTNLITKHFTKRNLLMKFIKNLGFDESVILVKGSRGMRMEEFVSEIKNKSVS